MKNKIEGFAASQEDFPSLLFKARKYLIARARPDAHDAPNPLPPLRRPEALGEQRRAWPGICPWELGKGEKGHLGVIGCEWEGLPWDSGHCLLGGRRGRGPWGGSAFVHWP